MNNAINGLVELLAYILCVGLLDKLGRRVLMCSLMLLGGVCCLTSMQGSRNFRIQPELNSCF